jgi:D-threo-aldose 1-dehydrogenase
MSSPEEVDTNINWLETHIPDDFWAELKSEGLVHADAPIQAGGL